jgi:uncharacterized protein
MAHRPFEIAGTKIEPGEYKELSLKVSEFYTSQPVSIPVFVKRGMEDGPILFVTAAIHGDEINGVQIVRNLIIELRDRDIKGTFIGVPVVNRFGFIMHQRDLPDNRDLNRAFPGSSNGSLAARYANRVFDEIIKKCTHGIDLHTAGTSRTNLPQVRCDIKHEEARRLAQAFGSTVILHHPGGKGTLRRAATDAGIPTIIFEAGETFKFERDVVALGKRGVLQVMRALGMIEFDAQPPQYQVIVKQSSWVRADRGGLLDVYVRPGDVVYEGDEIGVITNPFGREKGSLKAPFNGLVIGRVTLPLVSPGNPIAHLVRLEKAPLALVEKFMEHRTAPNAVPLSHVPMTDQSLAASNQAVSVRQAEASAGAVAARPADPARAEGASEAQKRATKPSDPATE